jgi:hypothetical protein
MRPVRERVQRLRRAAGSRCEIVRAVGSASTRGTHAACARSRTGTGRRCGADYRDGTRNGSGCARACGREHRHQPGDLAEKDELGAGDIELISAEQIDEVLTTRVPPPENAPQSWSAFGTEPRRRSSRWWSAAAALALLALGAQTVHYFRADVASHPTFGPWIQQAYGWVGVDLRPHWDVRQYEILDWVATAEPNARGLGSLKIAARIQNHGPLRQPYPAVQLRLKDRWEKAVSSRLFTPAEYLPRDAPRERLMSPGETARAQFEVVDPGPDAYGFELDVCIEVEASLVTCGTDEVFL